MGEIQNEHTFREGNYWRVGWLDLHGSNGLRRVQARPETVQSQKSKTVLKSYQLEERGDVLLTGRSVGEMIGQGQARVILDVHQIGMLEAGEVLVTNRTDPDWEPIMKKASAIVTKKCIRT